MADQRGRRDPARKSGAPGKGGAPRRGDASRGSGAKSGSGSERKPYDRKPGGRGRPTDRKPDGRRAERAPADRRDRADQATYDGPPLPPHITGAELSPSVRAHLKGMPEKLAARIARHLAAAGELVDDDPETAYQHAKAARARAPRIAVVREALGEAAYAAGHFAEALSELRAAKRMNGATAYLPIMADCHRALGNPTRALELAKSPAVARFAPAAKAEMTIVEAGARRDLGQFDAALRTLEVAPLNSKSREAWVVRLRYAYADTLEEAGRLQDALTWFHKTNAIDAEELTDAAERAESLEKRVERD
ncbi:tetratricopeptide repeat protein [Nocardioides sp. SYSU DS0651]|uniref:tetratricopeptide repeat protein n=1 Tax=Nocardioides sp. SYSU DS0651 TaxID=3415955 RepID=UPI003F4AF930